MTDAALSQPFDDYAPTCSGAPGSPLERAALDFEGRRFLATTMRGLAQDPIRVYAGVAHGDAHERARRAVEQLVALGAGDRSWLVVGAPTGRGWVDHVFLRAVEMHTDGDVASVASQFGADRSLSSSRLVVPAAESLRELLQAIAGEPALDPVGLVVFGESFGAWTLSLLFDELLAHRPAAIGFVGTPGVARLERHHASLDALRSRGTRVVRLEHADDPVVAFPGASLLWWPSPRWRPAATRRWLPVLGALRALRAVDRATRFVTPWKLGTTRHDYRPRLAALAADLLGFDERDRTAGISDQLMEAERSASTWRRSYGPAPHVPWPGPDD